MIFKNAVCSIRWNAFREFNLGHRISTNNSWLSNTLVDFHMQELHEKHGKPSSTPTKTWTPTFGLFRPWLQVLGSLRWPFVWQQWICCLLSLVLESTIDKQQNQTCNKFLCCSKSPYMKHLATTSCVSTKKVGVPVSSCLGFGCRNSATF